MSAFLKETQTSLERIVIDTLRPTTDDRSSATYFATLTLRTSGGTEIQLDARPSDAMALAVRLGLAVHVSRAIMDHNGLTDEHPPHRAEIDRRRSVLLTDRQSIGEVCSSMERQRADTIAANIRRRLPVDQNAIFGDRQRLAIVG